MFYLRRRSLRDHVDRAEPRRLARRLDRGSRRELADVVGCQLAVEAERQLAGDDQQRAGAHGRNAIGHRRGRTGRAIPNSSNRLATRFMACLSCGGAGGWNLPE